MSMEEESTHIDDDYYAFLNVDRNATQDELTKAYRRLSRLFHPDKHGDTDSQKAAETLFNKAQKAYEVLSDPQKRAIYDALGTKGLESDTWAVISRNKTPQEIREEFERLQKEKENYLRALTSPQGVIVVGINAIELFDNYADHESLLPNIEVSSLSVQQAVDLPLSRGNTATINAALDIDRGNGTGSIGTGLKRVFSDQSWGEFQYAAGQGPVVTLKYFRRIFRRSFFSVNGFTHITPLGIVPGTELVLGKHLSRHTVGTITWKPFPHSFMNTTITRNKNQQQVEAQVQLGVPTCFAKVSYSRSLDIGDSTRVRGAVMIGTLGYTLEYGCQTKISQHVVVGAAMEIGVPRGVTLRLKLHRANQTYLFSILLAEEVLPSAIFYGTVVPLFTFYCVKTLIIEPHKKRESELHLRKVQQENATKLEKAKAEAKAAVQLMTKTYERILHQETSLSGLVILKAFYGNALDLSDLSDLTELINKTEVIEVTIQLQCLIKDSCLILTPSSKASLPGIYDPCFGKEKKLRIEYKFRDRLHAVTINDEDSLRLPDPVHIV